MTRPEIRNTKSETNQKSKPQMSKTSSVGGFWHSYFEFVLNFVTLQPTEKPMNAAKVETANGRESTLM